MTRALTIPIASGTEPVIDIDDAHEAVGELLFGDIVEFCAKSPIGECQYDALEPLRCVHCKKESGI